MPSTADSVTGMFRVVESVRQPKCTIEISPSTGIKPLVIFFIGDLLTWVFAIPIRLLARPCRHRFLPKWDIGRKEKQLNISLPIGCSTDFSEIWDMKFSEMYRIFRFGSEAIDRRTQRSVLKALPTRSADAETDIGRWFYRRSVVLVFARFRTWRFVRARSEARVEKRGRTEFLHVARLVFSARR